MILNISSIYFSRGVYAGHFSVFGSGVFRIKFRIIRNAFDSVPISVFGR